MRTFCTKCFQSLGIKYAMTLSVGRLNFALNDIEEINPGCRNLQMPLIIINLSEIFLDAVRCSKYRFYQS